MRDSRLSPAAATASRTRLHIPGRLASWALALWIMLTAFSILALARHTALTFPYPWNDEARFYLPSWLFSHMGSLKPEILNAPQGIFWTPHGFYILLGSILAVAGNSIETARIVNQVLVAAAACVLVVAHRRVAGSAAFAGLSALLLVSPPVILAANLVRMESDILVLYAGSILLVSYQRSVAAFALLVLSLLFHPALGIALLLFCSVLLVYGIGRGRVAHAYWSDWLGDTSWVDWAFLGLVLCALLLQLIFITKHADLFRAHMGYQSARKLHRTLTGMLCKPQALILLLECSVASAIVWQGYTKYRLKRSGPDVLPNGSLRMLAQTTAIALGLHLYAVLGAEFAYDVYSLAVAPATFFCIAYRLFSEGTASGVGGALSIP